MSNPTGSPAAKAARRDDRTFARGKAAAARLIRALAVPDRQVQLAAAKALIDSDKAIALAIETAKTAEAERDRWSDAAPELATLTANLHRWYTEGVSDDAIPGTYRRVASLDAG